MLTFYLNKYYNEAENIQYGGIYTEIKYLGTAAYEGVPALFCGCETCRKSREAGGRAVRTRSQALIDGKLLIDFNADTFCHFLDYGKDMQDIEHCLITHAHSDHLYTGDLSILSEAYSHPRSGYTISFYGSGTVTNRIREGLESWIVHGRNFPLRLKTVKPFDTFKAGDYTVTALPAVHDEASGPLFYQISDGKKTLLYAHDTGYFCDSVWEYFDSAAPHFDLVSLDCTIGNTSCRGGHMALQENSEIRSRMLEAGMADSSTVFICNHFSHNGKDVFYSDFVPIAAEKGFLTSYDGMTVEF